MISNIINKFKGKEGWLLGKGPTLDVLPYERNGITIAINDTPCFANYRLWTDGCRDIIDNAEILQPDYRCPGGYPVYGKLDDVPLTPEDTSKIYQAGGSATAALHFAFIMGLCPINVLGIDGGGGYSKAWGMEYTEENEISYGIIRNEFDKLAKHLNLNLTIWTL